MRLALAISATCLLLQNQICSAQSFKIDTPTYDTKQITFTVDNRAISSADIDKYQNGSVLSADDIIVGSKSVAVRLGRLNDMMLITAFQRSGGQICTKHFYHRIRDGHDISIKRLGDNGGRELYGYRYGRKRDLYNVAGIREADFAFVWDPRAPKTGESRNANVPVPASGPTWDIVDGGCA